MLGLRAAGYTGQAQANGHGMEWERLGTSAEAMLRWAPMTARLLLARERHMHAVPLESVSLELMHGEGQWQNERPAEEKVEYTAAVGSVLAALGRLTALTRLDLCVAPATVRLDHMAVTLAQTVSSLGRLRLSMSWDAACTAAVLPSLRVLSQLTELTLNLRDARSGCLSGEAMREVVAGVGAAMLAGAERPAGVAEGGGAGGSEGESGKHERMGPGMASLQLLRLGPFGVAFESSVAIVDAGGQSVATGGAGSNMGHAVCVPEHDADWLELVGQLQRAVNDMRERLFVVLMPSMPEDEDPGPFCVSDFFSALASVTGCPLRL